MKTPRSRAQAIAAKCRECVHDPLAKGTWREQAAACVSGNCALHPFRPMPRNVKTEEDLAALRSRLEP